MIVVYCRLIPPPDAPDMSPGLSRDQEAHWRHQTTTEPLESASAKRTQEKGQDGLFLLGGWSGDDCSRFYHLVFFLLKEYISLIHNSGEFLFPR